MGNLGIYRIQIGGPVWEAAAGMARWESVDWVEDFTDIYKTDILTTTLQNRTCGSVMLLTFPENFALGS